MTVVVVFSSRRTPHSDQEYAELAARMEELVCEQPGFLRLTGVRDPSTRQGITVGYFADHDAVRAWRDHAKHVHARERGRAAFFSRFAGQRARHARDPGRVVHVVPDGWPPEAGGMDP